MVRIRWSSSHERSEWHIETTCYRKNLNEIGGLDTGKTLDRVLSKLSALKPRRIKTCVLLNKAARRLEDIQADYIGFEIPDYFVVGYGLDFAERYRNLPFVGVLHPRMYKKNVGKPGPARSIP